MEKNYKLFFSAYVIATIGDWFFKLAMPIYLFDKTGSALYMAMGYALEFLPFLLFTLFGGILADMYARKPLLVAIMFLSALFVLLISYLVHINGNLIFIYGIIFILSSLTTIGHPILQSFIVNIIEDKEKLASRNAFLLSVDNTLVIISPILSGVFISLFGSEVSFLINALALFIAAFFIVLIKVKEVKVIINKNLSSIFKLLTEGIVVVKNQPFLLYGSILFFCTNFSIHFFNVNFIYFLKEYFTATPFMVGICFTITGCGALLGSFLAPFFLKKYSENNLIVIMTILGGLFMYTLIFANNYITLGLLWGLVSFFGSINVVSFFTLRQKIVPSDILGRSIAITRMISYSSIPLAAILGGIVLNNTQNMILIIIIAATIRLLVGFMAIYTPLYNLYRSKQ